jgi:hypothetical protein
MARYSSVSCPLPCDLVRMKCSWCAALLVASSSVLGVRLSVCVPGWHELARTLRGPFQHVNRSGITRPCSNAGSGPRMVDRRLMGVYISHRNVPEESFTCSFHGGTCSMGLGMWSLTWLDSAVLQVLDHHRRRHESCPQGFDRRWDVLPLYDGFAVFSGALRLRGGSLDLDVSLAPSFVARVV